MANTAAASSIRDTPETIATNASRDGDETRLESEKRDTQPSDSLKNTIKGTIYDKESEDTLTAVWIGIKGTKINTTTNSEGKFSLVVPDDLTTPTITIVVKYMGYMPLEASFNRVDFPITRDFITIHPSITSMGEVIVVDKKKSSKKQ